MSLRCHLFVSDMNQRNEDFGCKQEGGFKIFLCGSRDGKVLPRSLDLL